MSGFKLLHGMSGVTPLPELDLFSVPPTQLSFIDEYETDERPLAIVENQKQIQFEFVTAPNEYIKLNESAVHLKVRIDLEKKSEDLTKKEDIKDTDWMNVSTVNNFAHSLFKHIDFSINGKNVVRSPSHYAFKAYFETLFGFTNDAKRNHLSAIGWTNDTSITVNDKLSPERTERIKPTTVTKDGKGKELYLVFKLHLDLALQQRCLIGGNKISITMYPNTANFVLMTSEKNLFPSFNFVDCFFRVHRVVVSPDIIKAHTHALMKTPAKYPHSRPEIKQYTLTPGPLFHTLENVAHGILPRNMFIVFLKHSAYIGDLKENPFNFRHFDVHSISAYIDGRQYPRQMLTPNFKNDLFDREYFDFHKHMNQTSTDATFVLDRKSFANGYTIFSWSFVPDQSDGPCRSGYVNPIKHGNLRVEIKLTKAFEKNVTVLTLCEYDSILEIDGNGEVTTSFV